MDLYSPSYNHDRDNSRRWFTIVALATLLGVSAVWFAGLVSQYGIQGALHYIWEGDPHPHMRERLDQLQMTERKIANAENLLVTLETALERSHLDSIDAAEVDAVIQQWQANLRPMNLQTRLALLSADLDKLAAQVDGVVSEGAPILKERKQILSKEIVKLMERVDVLISFYKQAERGN